MIRRHKISGHSMLPSLRGGDCIISEKLSYFFREPRIGEVIVLKHPKKPMNLVKRILGKSGDYYLAAGDNSGKFFIHRKNILGRVIMV